VRLDGISFTSDASKAVLLVSVELDEIFALSDRIIVLCGGRVTGERRPEETNPQDLGLLDGGRQQARRMSSPLKPLPVWADVAVIPLVNIAAAFVISGFVVLAIGLQRSHHLRRSGRPRRGLSGAVVVRLAGFIGKAIPPKASGNPYVKEQ